VWILFLMLAAVVVFAIVAVAAGVWEPPPALQADRPMLDRFRSGEAPIGAFDVVEAQFTRAWRGYRMDEVDLVLDRLAHEIYVRDQQLARLWADGHSTDTPGRIDDADPEPGSDAPAGHVAPAGPVTPSEHVAPAGIGNDAPAPAPAFTPAPDTDAVTKEADA
jgi:DivIVA domain-containing protein